MTKHRLRYERGAAKKRQLIDLESLRADVIRKAGDKSIRQVCADIGRRTKLVVADSTVRQIIEKTAAPSLVTYVLLCTWLGVSLDDYRNEI